MFRVLPFLIIFLFMLVFSKTLAVFEYIPELFSVAELNAQNTSSNQPSTPSSSSSASSNTQSSNSNTSEQAVHKGAKPMEVPICPTQKYSPEEVKVLESLSHRREQLQQRDDEISVKERLLKATEQRVENKINALHDLMAQAQKVLNEYNQKQKQEISTLVKIYENMKPKDAARIFDELQMPILVDICSEMKGSKLAPILALMDPNHAKDLTIELANRRKIDLSNFK